jgi:flagellar biosynthetic protein FliR
MTSAAQLLSISEALMWVYLITFLRVGPVISLIPGFGEQTVPARVKLALAFALTVVVAPLIQPQIAVADMPDFHGLAWLAMTETLIGFMIGIGLRLFVLALQTAGTIAGQATSLAQVLAGMGAEPIPGLGHILVFGGLALAMMTGLHVQVTRMIVLTYGLFPAAILPDAASVTQWGVRQVSGAFALAFTLAAPFVIVSVIYNLTLGIINRAMPQLMVVFVGAPVIAGSGIVLLLLLAPTMMTVWIEALQAFTVNPFGGG